MRCSLGSVPSTGCRAMAVAGRVNLTSLGSRPRRMRPSYAPFSEPFTECPALDAPSSPSRQAACCA
jgi:hypothetical protein